MLGQHSLLSCSRLLQGGVWGEASLRHYSITLSDLLFVASSKCGRKMREIIHLQAGQCGNQIGSKVSTNEQNRNSLSDLLFLVLGGDIWWTWHWSDRIVSWRQRPTTWTNQRLLQRSKRWKIRSTVSNCWLGTRNNGRCTCRTLWADFPSRQFRV